MSTKDQRITGQYALYCGDCCEVLPELPEDSVGLSVFSPPFVSLYSYSDDVADMGNSKTYDEFFQHFDFVIRQLFRVTMPGRNVCVHCCDLPMFKRNGDPIGLKEFPDDLVKAFKRRGFIYHSHHVIWKDPLIAATRTKAIGLAHKQAVKDSSLIRAGIPDEIVTFRKPGENPKWIGHPDGLTLYHGSRNIPKALDRYIGAKEQAKNKRSHWIWQQYASPVWFDIRQTYVLPYRKARDGDDEKHICIAEDSLVLTRTGYTPIQNVVVGDEVLTHKGRWRHITAKRCNGMRDTIQLHAQGVPFLHITREHQVWTRYIGDVENHVRKAVMRQNPSWIPAKDTQASYVNLKLPPIESTNYSLLEWWIAGRWLADGFYDVRDRIHIACGHHKLAAFLHKIGAIAGFIAYKGTVDDVSIKDRNGRLRSIISSFGSGASGKKVSADALSLSLEYAESFLDGYLSGDGSKRSDREGYIASSVSRPLLLGLAMIAQRARATVCSVYAGRKGRKTTICGREVNTKDEWVMTIDSHNLSGFIVDDGAWKKVRRIEDSEKHRVWDLQVEEDSSFTVEGCIVHNCPLQLDVIERCVALWSAPGDVVLTPFMGVGSEVYVAVKNRRKGVGIELKPSYYRQAIRNVQSIIRKREARKLI